MKRGESIKSEAFVRSSQDFFLLLQRYMRKIIYVYHKNDHKQ